MDRDHILSILRQHSTRLRERGVKGLVVFGPAARNEGEPGSTVDFLIELEPPHTFQHFLEIKLFLGEVLARPVELVVESPSHPEIRPYLEADGIVIF